MLARKDPFISILIFLKRKIMFISWTNKSKLYLIFSCLYVHWPSLTASLIENTVFSAQLLSEGDFIFNRGPRIKSLPICKRGHIPHGSNYIQPARDLCVDMLRNLVCPLNWGCQSNAGIICAYPCVAIRNQFQIENASFSQLGVSWVPLSFDECSATWAQRFVIQCHFNWGSIWFGDIFLCWFFVENEISCLGLAPLNFAIFEDLFGN